jgi:hypothetical protein
VKIGDAGAVYFVISVEDLAADRYERATAFTESD